MITLNDKSLNHPLLLEWVVRMPDEKADELLADLVLHDMREKLAKKRKEGRGGWHTANCDNEMLMFMLREHLEKGDMIDIINLAGMMHARRILFGEITGPNLQGRNPDE